MSASAPLGMPSRNTGKVAAVCTSATHNAESVSDVISQAAATSLIHMHRLAISQVLHNMRNTGRFSGANADCDSASVGLAGAGTSGGSTEAAGGADAGTDVGGGAAEVGGAGKGGGAAAGGTGDGIAAIVASFPCAPARCVTGRTAD